MTTQRDWATEPAGERIEQAVYDALLLNRRDGASQGLVDAWLCGFPTAPGAPPLPFSRDSQWLPALLRGIFEITGWLINVSYGDNGEQRGWFAALLDAEGIATGSHPLSPNLAACRAVLAPRGPLEVDATRARGRA